LNVTEQPLVHPSLSEDAKVAYLEAIVSDNRPLRLAGLDEYAGDTNSVRLSLGEIYIDLDTTSVTESESRQISASEALFQSSNHRMVLLGNPGVGKSTFVRYLALKMAQELIGEPNRIRGWEGDPLLPLVISLGRFAESLPKDIQKGRAEHLEHFLASTLEADKRMEPYTPHILEAIKKNEEGWLYLFDGLDEVANLELRSVVVEAIENYADIYGKNPDNKFLVTCRTYSYQDKRWQFSQWPQYELALFTDEQIQRFVTLWYDQHTLLDQKRAIEYEEKKRKLIAALRLDDRRRLSELARFPLILTVMAVVHASYELPDSRVMVYKQCVDLLLETWNTKRSISGGEQPRNILSELNVPRARIDQALYEIAFEARKGSDDASAGLVTEKLISGVMTEYLRDIEKVGVFLDYCQKANGLLMLQGIVTSPGSDAIPRRVYTFPHLTFEEYLAGRYLDGQGGKKVRMLLDQAHDRWREVTKLLAEYLCFESADRGRMNDILEALSSPFPQKPSDEDWRALWLAGELLTLYQRAFPKSSPFEDEITANLRKLLVVAALTPRERAEAANILDELGYQPDDLYSFVAISGEQPTLSKVEGAAFSIGKYPVTSGQYRRFVEAPDFAKKEYWVDFPKFAGPMQNYAGISDWGEAGWEWLQRNWDENKKVYPLVEIARAGVPVVMISWYEANAYCKWLQAHWAELPEAEKNPRLKPMLIRLPTESEWIAAAGGAEPADRYPWDKTGEMTQEKTEILRRTNVGESGIGRTTSVWMYPLGVSPLGVWDMGGNVWEWTSNSYDANHSNISLRGGSFHKTLKNANCVMRNSGKPGQRSIDVGFRIVLLQSEKSEASADNIIEVVETIDGELPVVKHQAMEELVRLDTELAKKKLSEWIIEPIAYEEWESAVQILSSIDPKAAREALIQALQHPDSGVRWNAAGLLAEIPDEKSWEVLQTAYKQETDSQLRQYLYELLEKNRANHKFIIGEYTVRFVRSVGLSEKKREAFRNEIDYLHERLLNFRDIEKIYLETVLFGSIARDTAIQPSSDIDVLVRLQMNPDKEEAKVAYDILDLVLPKIYKGKTIHRSSLGMVGRQQKRQFSSFGASFRIKLSEAWLEILPAVSSQEDDYQILIPDRQLRRWVPTNHELHTKFTQELDIATKGNYSSLVRAVKWWQYYHSPRWRYLSGFVLECLVGQYFDPKNVFFRDTFENFLIEVQNQHQRYQSLIRVSELGVQKGYKQTGLSKRGHERFMALVDETLIMISRAQKALSIQDEVAIWREIFGPAFPEILDK